MSAQFLAPELEAIANRYRLPVEAYHRLMDLGFLEDRFEILDGAVISNMRQNPQHAGLFQRIFLLLAPLFGPGRIRAQVPISIPGDDGLYNEPEPDIAITRDSAENYQQRHPGPDDLLLVVELSDTTLRTDLILKARLYARAGIAEYWVIDLDGRSVSVHAEPSEGAYGLITVYSDTDSIPFSSGNMTLAAPSSCHRSSKANGTALVRCHSEGR